MSSNALITSTTPMSVTRSDDDVDALPYVDREIEDPAMKATVDRLIDQELRRMRRKEGGDGSSLPMQIELFQSSDILKQELERLKRKEPLNALDISRYELKGPEDEESESVEAWQAAVDNTKAQLESQAVSTFNLELLSKYGANAWRVHNYQLEAYLKQLQACLDDMRAKIRDINRDRKAEQTQAAGSLRSLENRWSDLISQNLQVDIACSALEAEVEELRRYKESLETSK